MFWTYSIILAIRKFGTLRKASKKGGLVEHSKVIADYMMVEHQLGQDMADPTTMKGYSYIFTGEEELASLLPTAPGYRIEGFEFKEVISSKRNGSKEVTIDRFVTIDFVWRWIDSHSFKYRETPGNLRQTTLAFTLFKLLKRRFCGYQLGEAGLDKTLHLVLHGLLSNKGKYVGAFGVIEEELSLLYDFFYTRMGSGMDHWILSGPVICTAIVWNGISGAFSRHYHRSNLEQRVNGADVIHWITIVLLATLVFVHIVRPFLIPYRLQLIEDVRRWTVYDNYKPRTLQEQTAMPTANT
jgi:antibiotic biosynthesis monooxygenase (ABM) superfamily enzyme